MCTVLSAEMVDSDLDTPWLPMKLHSFLTKFKVFYNAGFKASLQLDCSNGQAKVSLDVSLWSLQGLSNGSVSDTSVKQKRKRLPAYYRRQEVRRKAKLSSTSTTDIKAAEEVAVEAESQMCGTEVNQAEEVCIESIEDSELSVDNEKVAEDCEHHVQQDLDEDLSEQLQNLIMESQRSREDWDQRKALLPPEDSNLGPS